jgi:hypothetical protein
MILEEIEHQNKLKTGVQIFTGTSVISARNSGFKGCADHLSFHKLEDAS